MDEYAHRVRSAADLTLAARCITRAIVALEEARLFYNAAQAEELLFEAVQVRREVLEAPRETGVPAPLQESPDPTKEDVPF